MLPVGKMAPRDAVAAAQPGPSGTPTARRRPGSAEACSSSTWPADAAGRTQALLHNAAGDQGVSLKFNKKQLPCFTLWKNRQAAADGYVTGLEPATNFPNAKSFEKEQGRVAVLAAGQSRDFEITVEVHPDAQSVAAAAGAVEKISRGGSPKVFDRPNPEWSAGTA